MSGRKVYVGQLNFKTTERNLRDFLSDCGELEEVVIITDRETGDSRGFGFATFADQDAAEEACRRSGEELDGREIIINYARDRGDRGGRDRGYNRGYGRGGGGGYGRDRGGYDRNRSGYGRDRDGYGRDRGGYGRDREDRDDNGGRRQY